MVHSGRTCQACGKPLIGRIDKKFCDDACRNNFNNQSKASTTNLMRNIINALRKNRQILDAAIGNSDNMIKWPKKKLIDAGFNFSYMTHQYITKKGTVYYYCFDLGYLLLEHDWVLIVRRVENPD